MNRLFFLFFIFFFLNVSGFAQEVEFLPNDWENPAVFEKGQNAPHAFHIPFLTKEAALKNEKKKVNVFSCLMGSGSLSGWKRRNRCLKVFGNLILM